MASRGRFIPRFPEKYMGDPNKIFFRSSWEIRAMKYWDSRPDVLRWNSEEIVIPYLSPKDNRVHEYYPDFYVELLDRDKVLQKYIVEVKPLHESEEKFAKSTYSKDALDINNAKWGSAAIYCATRGIKFKTITEKSLFLQKPKKVK
jgi:TnsA endonuclease N terminal